MTEDGWATLQRHLLSRYGDFKRRLTRYLGSADLASEALHDTWIRLERGGELATVRNPDTYLYSMAINVAANNRRAEHRRLSAAEIDILLEIPDESPEPDDVVVARQELDALVAIIGDLTERQQAILLAARVEGLPRREIAARFGVSERLVQRELRFAHDYCAARFEKISSGRFASGTRKVSSIQEEISEKTGHDRDTAYGTDE